MLQDQLLYRVLFGAELDTLLGLLGTAVVAVAAVVSRCLHSAARVWQAEKGRSLGHQGEEQHLHERLLISCQDTAVDLDIKLWSVSVQQRHSDDTLLCDTTTLDSSYLQ